MSEALVFLDCGGPEYDISVAGKVYHFEWHPYCGPVVLTKKGEPAASQPELFLKAASLWAQQGKQLENGMCVWHHDPGPILVHLGGRHWKIVGMMPGKKGGAA